MFLGVVGFGLWIYFFYFCVRFYMVRFFAFFRIFVIGFRVYFISGGFFFRIFSLMIFVKIFFSYTVIVIGFGGSRGVGFVLG